MRLLLVGIAILLSASAFAQAPSRALVYTITGKELHEACRSNRTEALGYVLGVADGEARRAFETGEGRVCLPAGATRGQLLEIVCSFIDDRPEIRDRAAGATLVVDALSAEWPC